MRMYLENGYDFVPLPSWQLQFMSFPSAHRKGRESHSQFQPGLIAAWEDFESLPWPDPEKADYGLLDELTRELPPGARFIAMGPCGVFENLVELIGFENLCFLLADEPELVRATADAIGSRLLRYYERFLEYPSVGAVILNDDWGFKTQTMIGPDQLREFVFPWHRRMAASAHAAGRPVILHSCGQLESVWEDIIDDLRFDGKHSYEDGILPVEEAWKRYGHRIAILGGLDLDFLVRHSAEEVERRARQVLELTGSRAYALGSGNSIARYVPPASFRALTRAALT